jgi:TM2 domain-containing membrane protein YozV
MSEESSTPEPTDQQTPPAPETPPAPAPAASGYTKEQKDKKLIAGLLGIFLGGFGVHKFYLGYSKEGIIQLVITIVTCGIASIIGLIEGILYLTKTDDEFVATYVVGRKGWF